MPPHLALAAGAALVWYAFRTDRKRGIAIAGVFWPTLWYMVVASRMVGVWLSTWGFPLAVSSDATDGSPIDRLFFLVLTIIGVVILARRRFDWGAALRQNAWITALLVFMAISIVWSPYPFVSFKRYVKVLGSVTMALVVLTNGQPLEAVFTVLRRVLYVHLPMSIVCVKYFRDIGVTWDWDGKSSSWQGISLSKNDMGQVAMLGALYFLWETLRQWKVRRWRNLHLLYLAMAVYLLKGSDTAISLTSVSTTILTVVVFFNLQRLRSRVAAARRFAFFAFAGTGLLVALVLLHSIVMFSPNSLFGWVITTFGRNITLTDRTFIWHDVYAAASAHPLIGVGFGGFWIGRLENIPWDANMTWVLGEAHNGYIDTYLQTGLIGLSLLVIVLVVTVRRLLATLADDFGLACFRITVFMAILYVNITETTYLRGDNHLWFVMQLVVWFVPAAVIAAPASEAEPTERLEANAEPVLRQDSSGGLAGA